MSRSQYVRLLGVAGVLIVLAIILQFTRTPSSKPTEVSAAIITTPTPAILSNDILINMNNPVRNIDAQSISVDESTYGKNKSWLTVNPTQQAKLKTLAPALMRVELFYTTPGDPNSTIACGSSGCPKTVKGDDWIKAIKAVGAEPMLIVPMNAVDAANLVRYFNITQKQDIRRWIVGNEPDNHSISATSYIAQFDQIYAAMKAVDPTIKIGGPANSHFNSSFIEAFIKAEANKVDFIDYHSYGQGGSNNLSEEKLLSQTQKYEDNFNQIRTWIQKYAPTRANQIGMQIGEWNLDWDNDPKEYTNFTTVWAASALGHQLRGGGISLAFATKNGGLGLLYEEDDFAHGAKRDDPMPIYHALSMFTGAGLFPRFGTTLVSAVTDVPNLEIFASNNPRTIVVVNKDPRLARKPTVNFMGLTGGTVQVWRKEQSASALDGPVNLGTFTFYNNKFDYTFPPYSVTTFVVSTNLPTAIPTLQPSATPVPPTPTKAPITITPSKSPSLTPIALPTQIPTTSSISIFGLPSGQPVSGTYYIEARSTLSKILYVDFFVDNVEVNKEYVAPYNMGTFSNNVYKGYNTNGLSSGKHILRVDVITRTGTTESASFSFVK